MGGGSEKEPLGRQCPLWVTSRHMQCKTPCPVYPRERTCAVQLGMSALGQKRTSSVECKYALPVVLHANHGPGLLLRLVVKRLGKCPDLGVWQSLCWAIGIFAFRIVVHHQHHQTRASAGPGVFKHLPVTVRITERCVWTASDHQVNALRLAGLVIVQK